MQLVSDAIPRCLYIFCIFRTTYQPQSSHVNYNANVWHARVVSSLFMWIVFFEKSQPAYGKIHIINRQYLFRPRIKNINAVSNTVIPMPASQVALSYPSCAGYSCRASLLQKHAANNKSVPTIPHTADIWRSWKQSKVSNIGQILWGYWTNTTNNIGKILWRYWTPTSKHSVKISQHAVRTLDNRKSNSRCRESWICTMWMTTTLKNIVRIWKKYCKCCDDSSVLYQLCCSDKAV